MYPDPCLRDRAKRHETLIHWATRAYGGSWVANEAAGAGLVRQVDFAGRKRMGRSCERRRGRHKYPVRAGVSTGKSTDGGCLQSDYWKSRLGGCRDERASGVSCRSCRAHWERSMSNPCLRCSSRWSKCLIGKMVLGRMQVEGSDAESFMMGVFKERSTPWGWFYPPQDEDIDVQCS